ncbi:MAG: PKD domain-containing protein [Gammaproteobacteria bacterium]|nr:PKD domain-containing protein [Gammaproteobacteria bacterium]
MLLKQLSTDPDIEVIEPDFVLTTSTVPTDPSFGQLWGLVNTGQAGGTSGTDISVESVWNSSNHGNGVVVAVVDTGVDYTHTDLSSNMWINNDEIADNGVDDDGNGYIDDVFGYDFANNDGDPIDDNEHGTHVAGTIAASANNGVGVAGVAWSAKIMSVKFLTSRGGGYTSDAIQSIQYAIDMGANIINASWGGSGYSQLLFDAVSAANDAGITLVAAAGNSSINIDMSKHYPSSFNLPNVISVAAFDRYGNLAGFSNWGPESVHVAAPGKAIYSTVLGDTYRLLSGTSMAAPHVSGAAALLLSEDMTRTPEQIKQLLISTSSYSDTLSEKTISKGRINISDAFSCVPGDMRIVSTSLSNNFDIRTGDEQVISVKVYSCDQQVKNAQLSVKLNGANVKYLNDSGLNGDEQAGDGKYSISWKPDAYGDVTLEFTATHNVYSTSSITIVGTISQSQDYQVDDTIPFNWQDATGGTSLSLGDDQSTQVDMGFPFRFFGNAYEIAYVSSNGMLTFGKGSALSANTAIPSPIIPNNYIAVLWSDLNPSLNGNIYSAQFGVAPNRKLVISWNDVSVFNGSLNGGTFQAILHEGSNDIVLQYQDVLFGSQADNGGQATVGIENSDGSQGVQYSYKTPSLNNNKAIRFRPALRPVANPGGAYQSEINQPVNFFGSASSDRSNAVFSYAWNFGDGTISTEHNPVHTYTQRGVFEATLKVNDGFEDSLPATTSVIIGPNQLPAARAGGPYTGYANQIITLDGSQSTDPDGDALGYNWDFGDGNVGFGISPSYTYNAPGIYTVFLSVSDGYGTSTSTATVTLENRSPVAEITAPLVGALGVPVNLSALASHDPDNQSISYSWDFGDGQSSTLANPAHIFASTGVFNVTLTVSDGILSNSTQHFIEIIVNTTPIANPGGPYQGYVGSEIAFDGSGSVDADGDMLSYIWDFGDGSSANGISPTHVYTHKGNYTASLLVNDGFSDSVMVTTSVVIPNRAPTAEILSSENSRVVLGHEVSFSGSGSFDPDGDNLSYKWIIDDVGILNSILFFHAFSTPGNHTVQLIVNDGEADSLPVTKSFFVISPPIALAGGTQIYSSGETATLDANYSFDTDGYLVDYRWQQISGNTVEIQSVDSQQASFVTPPANVHWKMVSAGEHHTCAIDSMQSLWCWGSNYFQQIPSYEYQHKTPVVVEFAEQTTWQQVSTGARHTCAISADNRLYCWGDNSEGQLGAISGGNGILAYVAVLDGTNWRMVDSSRYHSCAVDADSQLFCWGRNSSGQLGLGDNSSRASPGQIYSPVTNAVWKTVKTGLSHTCALDTSNSLWCWGSNGEGQLGIGDTIGEATQPMIVPTPNNATSWLDFIVGDSHSCGIGDDGKLYCWGTNGPGWLGTEDKNYLVFSPSLVVTEHDFTQLSAGTRFTCALATDKQTYCWGKSDTGQTGARDFTEVYSPTSPIQFYSNIAQISTGAKHSCLLNEQGAMACWGDNTYYNISPSSQVMYFAPALSTKNENVLTFSVTVTDNDGLTSTSKTPVIINQPPTAMIPNSVTTFHNTPVEIDGALSHDAELAQLNYSWKLDGVEISTSPILRRSFSEPGEYLVQLTVNDGYAESLPVTTTVFVNATPTAHEGHINSVPSIVKIEVYSVNDAPVAVDDHYKTTKGTELVTGNALENDSDADGDQLIVMQLSQPDHGTVYSNNDGTFTYTPQAGYVGTDKFTYTITDGHQGMDDGVVRITVEELLPDTQKFAASFNIEKLLLDASSEEMVFRIKPTSAPLSGVTLRYYTTDGTAYRDIDFGTIEGSVHWDKGDATEREIAIPLLAKEYVNNIYFNLVFVVEEGNVIFENGSTAIVTIAKNLKARRKLGSIAFEFLLFTIFFFFIRDRHNRQAFMNA